MWFCTYLRKDTANAVKILSDRCWNVLPHQEQRIRRVYKLCRDSQQYSSSDKEKKKQQRRTEKLVVTDSQTEKFPKEHHTHIRQYNSQQNHPSVE